MKKLLLIILTALPLIGFSQKVIRGEYFFDTDPGIGNGTNISVTTPADSVEINFTASVSSLTKGLHNLYVRMLNDSGVWSQAENRLVNVYTVIANQNIVKSEYFFDTDPGVGLGTAISVGTTGDSVEFSSTISVSALTKGLHNLYIRTKNINGVWSISENRLVNVFTVIANQNIVASEYFFDTDPGVGLGTSISSGAAADSVDFVSTITVSSISLGLHNLYIRTKNSNGVWSISENRLVNVYKNSNSIIVASEYFINTDPGVGNGVGSLIATPADSVEFTTSAPVAGLGLPLGTNYIYERTQNSDGVWSLAEGRAFNMCDTIGVATAITGRDSAAACINQNGITYSTDTIYNAQYYAWTLPPGATIVAGDSTTSIVVNFDAYSQSGLVTVAGARFGGCTGTASTLFVNFKPIPAAQICYATVDSLTQLVELFWQKPVESYALGYVIYKEIATAFVPLDTVPDSQFSSYVDATSTPALGPETYKIGTLDSCGNVASVSDAFEHQSIRLYGYIVSGGVAKLYWNEYIGINDPNRYYRVLRDNSGNGSFSDVLITNIAAGNTGYSFSDTGSASHPTCRYVIDMVADVSCNPSLRALTSRSTTRSNIRNRTFLFDTLSVGTHAIETEIFNVHMYPNPAKDIVNIRFENNEKNVSLQLSDILGRVVITQNKEEIKSTETIQLPLSNLSKGLYVLQIQNLKQKHFYKLLVQ